MCRVRHFFAENVVLLLGLELPTLKELGQMVLAASSVRMVLGGQELFCGVGRHLPVDRASDRIPEQLLRAGGRNEPLIARLGHWEAPGGCPTYQWRWPRTVSWSISCAGGSALSR